MLLLISFNSFISLSQKTKEEILGIVVFVLEPYSRANTTSNKPHIHQAINIIYVLHSKHTEIAFSLAINLLEILNTTRVSDSSSLTAFEHIDA